MHKPSSLVLSGLAWLCLACGTGVSLSSAAEDDSLAWVYEYLNAGRYQEATDILRKDYAKAEKGSPRWFVTALKLVDALRIVGQYQEALGVCDNVLSADAKLEAARMKRAELLSTLGRYEEALKVFDELIEADKNNLRAWGLRVQPARALGKKDILKKTADHTFELYKDKSEYYNSDEVKDPLEPAYIGLGIQDENAKDAFEVGFLLSEKLILKRNLKDPEPFLWAAELAFEKYAYAYAMERYMEILKFRPKLPEAQTGRARVLMAARHDSKGAEPILKEALEINPNLIDAHLVKAAIALQQDRFDDMKASVEKALAVNPNHLEALAMLAFYYHYSKQPEKAAEIEKKALALNPKNADYYCLMGELFEDKLSFDDSPPYFKKAIELDPEYWRGYYGLGMNTSRQGAHGEAPGRELLAKGFAKNKFNPWASNMIFVLKKFLGDEDTGIPAEYRESKTEHFVLKFHKKEADIVRPYLEEWAEEAYQAQAKLFGFEPTGPLTIELCYSKGDQDARTVGIPMGGILGVCFGKLSTVLSPREGGGNKPTPHFNWRKVMEHEYAHVMALQMSSFRVPLWFTEALSTYVEDDSRLNTDQLLVDYYDNDQLKPIEKMQEYIFENRIMAYVHGRFVIQWLAKTHGFEAVQKCLKLFKDGKTLAETLTSITGKDMAAINAGVKDEFKAFLKKVRLRPTLNPAKLAKIELAASKSDASAQELADLAIALLTQKRAQQAQAAANKALEKDPKCADALNVLGIQKMTAKDYEAAKNLYQQSTEVDPERSFTAWHKLGIIYKKEGRTTKAIEAFEKARALYPRYVGEDNPHYALPELYMDQEPEQADKAMAVWLDALKANTDDAEAALKGLKHAVAIKDWKAAERCAMAHIEINPYVPEVHQLAGRAYEEMKDLKKAAREYRVAAALNEKDVESWVKLGRMELQLGNRDAAAKAAEKALDVDGTHEGAKDLKKQLGL